MLCGVQGYKTSIEAEGFAERSPIHRVIFKELTKTLDPLPLDAHSRCAHCAEIMDKHTTK